MFVKFLCIAVLLTRANKIRTELLPNSFRFCGLTPSVRGDPLRGPRNKFDHPQTGG